MSQTENKGFTKKAVLGAYLLRVERWCAAAAHSADGTFHEHVLHTADELAVHLQTANKKFRFRMSQRRELKPHSRQCRAKSTGTAVCMQSFLGLDRTVVGTTPVHARNFINYSMRGPNSRLVDYVLCLNRKLLILTSVAPAWKTYKQMLSPGGTHRALVCGPLQNTHLARSTRNSGTNSAHCPLDTWVIISASGSLLFFSLTVSLSKQPPSGDDFQWLMSLTLMSSANLSDLTSAGTSSVSLWCAWVFARMLYAN